MRKLEEFVNEKLKVSKNNYKDAIYDTIIDGFRKMHCRQIMFCNFVEDFNGDYPKFQSWNGMNTADKRLVGKKFSHMCLSNIRGIEGLYVYFRRRVKGIEKIIIQNATDLYNVFGEKQALILCNIVKKRIEADEKNKKFYEGIRKIY